MSGRARRVFHPSVPGEGAEVTLDPDESHHLARVLRLRMGDAVSVFDGRGSEWDARIVDPSNGAARLTVGAKRDDLVEAPLQIALVQGACRPDRVEWVLQKGTEIGVSDFTVVPFARSEGGDPPPARLERWRKIVVEACKQSGRRTIPQVIYLDIPPALEVGELGIVLDSGTAAPPIAAVLAASPAPRPSAGPPSPRVRIAVGPEGGFEPDEIESLVAHGWQRAGLGPRVLRTETAGPVAAAIVLHVWGDLGRTP